MPTKTTTKGTDRIPLKKQGKKSAFPTGIEPMLATLVDKPFDEPGWTYEVKWDGYRALGFIRNGVVELRSRNNKSFDEKFYPVYDALLQWGINAVVDGEIIVLNDKGASDFNQLQSWRSEADGQLIYYLFDILWLDGYDVTQLPLEKRHDMLRSMVPESSVIRMSESFDTGATELFEVIREMQLEGLIAKKAGSVYMPGTRSKDWLKIKTEKRQEAVIAGYTRNETTSKKFSALLMGIYEGGEFRYIGPVGTGFSNRTQDELLEKLKPLVTRKCPFKTVPEYNKPSRFRPNPPPATVTWVKPKLVAEISYRTLTNDGSLRHPSFKGLREDKDPEDVRWETPKQTEDVLSKENPSPEGRKTSEWKKKLLVTAKAERKTLLNPKDQTQVRKINGHDIRFNNLDKIYFPAVNITKRDVINYYYQVAPYMLPYMKDRPQTLIRYPNGIDGESFYQKDVTGKVPAWIEQFPYSSERGGDRNFLVCTDEASLLYIASIGGIEMHPWSSRAQKPDHPDWCIIDLDPDRNSFDQVVEAANVTREVLQAIEVPCYCKTSGSTGLHIYIPFGAKYTYEESKEFARKVVKIVHAQIPGYTSIERLTGKRQGKMYLDFLQNRPQATLAAPYSLRPKPTATVSMPLHWEEVKKGLKIGNFTILNAVARLMDTGDIFTPVLGKGIDLRKTLQKIERIF